MKKLVFIVIAALVLAGGAYFVVNRDDSKTNEESSTTSTDTDSFARTTSLSDACAVFTKAEIEAAFAKNFEEAVPETKSQNPGATGVSSCTYQEINDGTPAGLLQAINFSVQVDSYDSNATAEATMQATKNSAELAGTVYFIRTDVPDVADEAFFFQGQAPLVLKTEEYMYVRKGSQIVHLVAVRIDGIDHVATQASLKKLAEQL